MIKKLKFFTLLIIVVLTVLPVSAAADCISDEIKLLKIKN